MIEKNSKKHLISLSNPGKPLPQVGKPLPLTLICIISKKFVYTFVFALIVMRKI